ncbi:DUF4917 family protein [Vibrio metoecus]|uniref:DUF4917 family protein n=1 Tax=Vibrio metoecus TaxID=1481663 RepID=UPI001F2C0D01|nr:DUF4917 family protein [Vibrio metoecus]
MLQYEIFKWSEISSVYFGGSLLLGNGASMSVDSRFGYSSLVDHAYQHNLLNEDIQKLFKFFKTNDFELILRLVWQASNVNRSLGIHDERTHQAYIRVRECLIKSVRSIHPEYTEISRHLPVIYNFIRDFDTVISLNYDLILYWTIMYGRGVNDNHAVKDCFPDGRFYDNWRYLRKPIYNERSTTLVFYPHGSLVLARDNVESESKVISNERNLLESILQQWQSESVVPLFVSEGTSSQKVNSIRSSNYLNTVHREVLTGLGSHLVIYGWGLGEQDSHILERLSSSWVRRVAVSVYGNDQAYCHRVFNQIHQKLGHHVTVEFFQSDSPGCWNIVA